MGVIKKIKKYIQEKFFPYASPNTGLHNWELDELKFMIGQQMSIFNRNQTYNSINDYEFKVFSQWGDDGIIQYLIKELKIENGFFIEFGVENYQESNTRFLLMNNNWSGLIIDGSSENIEQIKHSELYWKFDLTAICSFVTKNNINDLIIENLNGQNADLLHIDIDGNDYWIWEEISVISPAIVIVEYNSLFGNDRMISVPYDPGFVRQEAHYSYLYAGCSLPALEFLANKKGYFFVGSNLNGNNAYFLKNEYKGEISEIKLSKGYIKSKFRECREKDSTLNFNSHDQNLEVIKGLKVVNVTNGLEELI